VDSLNVISAHLAVGTNQKLVVIASLSFIKPIIAFYFVEIDSNMVCAAVGFIII